MAFCDEAEAISGDILVNFRPTIFSEAVKLGFVMSVAVSFPLVIFPCRTSIHTLLFAKVRSDIWVLNEITKNWDELDRIFFWNTVVCVNIGFNKLNIYIPFSPSETGNFFFFFSKLHVYYDIWKLSLNTSQFHWKDLVSQSNILISMYRMMLLILINCIYVQHKNPGRYLFPVSIWWSKFWNFKVTKFQML